MEGVGGGGDRALLQLLLEKTKRKNAQTEEKYLQRKLHARPSRGTAGGFVRRQRLLAGEHNAHEKTTRLRTQGP